jgi:putative Mg2+ transporter-C (MgtC) family protein
MSGWEELARDFGDLGNLVELVRLLVSLLFASVLGGAVGYQREKEGKAAGMRTHMIVTVGAALFLMLSREAGMSTGDLSRVIQGLATGVGFLGAGAIIKRSDANQVEGLTTAAGIWLATAVGAAVGIGRIDLAILGTVFALIILTTLQRLDRWIEGDDARPPSPLLRK